MEIDLSTLSGYPYDLIIVGSGPAGLTLARKYDELAAGSGRVLIVESGHRSNSNSDAQKLNVMDASGDLPATYYPPHNQRVFGGTSSVWRGYCAVLEKRSFLNSEWPFAYDELYKWYPEAAKILNLPEESHTVPEKAFPDNPNIIYRPYYLSRPPTRFSDLFGDWLTQSRAVSVLFNHTVTGIGIQNSDASSIFIRESSGARKLQLEVFGHRIVLATGGIQNARLLQLSIHENRKLTIGTHFLEHPHLYNYAELILDWEKFCELIVNSRTISFDEFQTKSKSSMVHAISLSSEFSQAYRLISATFDLRMSAPLASARILLRNILGRRRKVIVLYTTIRAEMNPYPWNRVILSDSRKDLMGQPIAHVELKFNPQEILTICKHLDSQLIRSGLGRLKTPRKMEVDRGGGHMMGTTRMGSDPTLSVTDAQGKVHGIKNLYVAGSSLFPAAAAANPTFTIVALSLRLAAHLAKEKTA